MSNSLVYLWLDNEQNIRFKIKIVQDVLLDSVDILSLSEYNTWNFDGSSTGQAIYQSDSSNSINSSSKNTEIILKVKTVFPNPLADFACKNNYLCLCETFHPDLTPTASNTRFLAQKIFKTFKKSKPWFGMEQEYFIYPNIPYNVHNFNSSTSFPLGFTPEGQQLNNFSQGPFYCGLGADRAYGRKISEKHLKACVQAKLTISGTNQEVAPGQWEYQIGPVKGIKAGDQMIIARYLLLKIAEEENCLINFQPKPLEGWNGSGCHVNFSTIETRKGPYQVIEKMVEKLAEKHSEHMQYYGKGNELRMSGKYETSDFKKFCSGVGDRSASVRIPTKTYLDKKGYFEDRRPAANADMYRVTSLLCQTCLNN